MKKKTLLQSFWCFNFSCRIFLPAVVSNTAQLYSAKPEIKHCPGWNAVHSVSEVFEGERLRQWSRLEVRFDVLCSSTISQKHFINSTRLRDCLWHNVTDPQIIISKKITCPDLRPKTGKNVNYSRISDLQIYNKKTGTHCFFGKMIINCSGNSTKHKAQLLIK